LLRERNDKINEGQIKKGGIYIKNKMWKLIREIYCENKIK
jgi:hypothetical protein